MTASQRPPSAGAAGGVDEHERVVVGARGPDDGGHGPGGGLVVRPAVGVDPGLAGGQGDRAGVRLRDHRVSEERCLGDGRGELRGELAIRAERGTVADEADRGGVPEGRRPTVAQDDLVAVGQVEQLGEPLADLADEPLDRRLPV
jgi:hypothetical protein